MNKKTARYRGLAFDPRFVFRSSVIGLALSLASLCLAATLAPNSIVPSPHPLVTAVPVTSHAFNQPSRHPAALAPAQYSECLQLLGGTDHVSPVLVDTVSSLLNHQSRSEEHTSE